MMDYRDQRRAYRRQTRYQRRGYYGGIGGGIWLVVLILIFASSHWIWSILPFLIIPFFFMVIRPRLFGSRNNMNQQQPYDQQQPYNQQPYNQPYQPDQPIYQPPVQEDQPNYQSYTQGYKPQATPAQPVENYQEAGQQYQYPPQQTGQQQYEEPLTMYPQE